MRILKRIVELIFIFILPILLLLCTFKKTYVYDSNNNVVSERLQFDNIFSISEGDISYEYIEYYSSGDSITLDVGDSFIMNPAVSQFTYLSRGDSSWFVSYIFNSETDNFLYSGVINNLNDIRYQPFSESTTGFTLEYIDGLYEFTRSINAVEISCQFGNIVKDIKYLTIRDNIVNRGLNIIFGYFGISDNIVLQLLVVYVLLMLVMLLIWYVIYVPFDMLFGLLLRKLEYYR